MNEYRDLDSASGLSEADTRAKLIDPTIHACGWHEDMIRREKTARAINAIVRQFKKGGIEGMENQRIFKIPEVQAVGGIKALAAGGNPAELLLRETKERMFSA